MTEIVVQRTVDAPTQVVFELFTDPELLTEWMAVDATVDPRPGGAWRWTHANGDSTSGTFLELDPPRRLVFSYGWEEPELGIPPGSTTVEVELTELGGRTRVKVIHRGLDSAPAERHRGGWEHYLGRLETRAAGGDPGRDPLADLRADGSTTTRRR